MFAVRNPSKCSKECLCLFVCPTGATSTEDGTIDASKCIDGCRACVDACPEHAIYLVPDQFPETPSPETPLLRKIAPILETRAKLRTRLALAAEDHEEDTWKRVFAALELSARILGEDCVRASGQLTPQPGMLTSLLDEKALQSLDSQIKPIGDTPLAEQVLELLLTAVNENRDADCIDLCVCNNCGAIYRGPAPETCAACGSGDIETVA